MANKVDLESVSQPVFGLSSRRYRQLAKEGIVPEPSRGKIDFVKAAKGLLDYYRRLAEGDGDLSLTDERKALVRVQRQLKELELLVEKKKLIPRSEVMDEFLSRIAAVKTGLLSLHRSLPPQLVGKDARAIAGTIKKQVRQLLERFSRKGGVLRR